MKATTQLFFLILACLSVNSVLLGQAAEIEARVKSTDVVINVIDSHSAADTLSLPEEGLGVTSPGSIHPAVKGYWHDGKLEKIVTLYLGEAGKKWEAAYYFQDDRLIYLNSEYATEMDYMGPGFYVVQYRNAHYIQDNKPYYRNYEGSAADMPELYKDAIAMAAYANQYFTLLKTAKEKK